MDIQARPMTRAERKAFQSAGLDMRRNASQFRKWHEAGEDSQIAVLQDEAEDWILDNMYPELPAEVPNNEASKLATDTYNLTFGLAEEEKNS